MKPFRINRNSWHYKLNKNFFNEDSWWMERTWEPRHNNFCSYWRATVFRLLFATLLVAMVTTALGGLGYYIYANTSEAVITLGAIIAAAAVLIGTPILLMVTADKIKQSETIQRSIIMQRIRNHKSKICPSVEYEK